MSIYTYELCDISATITVPAAAMDAVLGRFFPAGGVGYTWQPLKDGDVWEGFAALLDKDLECDIGRPYWEKDNEGNWSAPIDWVGCDLDAVEKLYSIEKKVEELGGRVEY